MTYDSKINLFRNILKYDNDGKSNTSIKTDIHKKQITPHHTHTHTHTHTPNVITNETEMVDLCIYQLYKLMYTFIININ